MTDLRRKPLLPLYRRGNQSEISHMPPICPFYSASAALGRDPFRSIVRRAFIFDSSPIYGYAQIVLYTGYTLDGIHVNYEYIILQKSVKHRPLV